MSIRVAGAQINLRVGDLAGNEEKIAAAIERAKAAEADVLLVPELALTGYPPEDLVHRSDFVDANLEALARLSTETEGLTAVVGFVDRTEGSPRGGVDSEIREVANAAGVLGDGEIKGVYHKVLLPNFGVFDEDRYFAVGDDPAQIWDVAGEKVGVSVCEDIWVADGPPADQAAAGAGSS